MHSDHLRFVTTGQSLIRQTILHHEAEAFRAVLPVIQAADVAFTNMEGTIQGDRNGYPVKNGLCHAAPAAVLDDLAAMGFNALALSNNHAFDLGPAGIMDTIDAVARRGLLHAGTGPDLAAAASPGVKTFSFGQAALIAMDAGPQPDHAYAKDAMHGLPGRAGNNPLPVQRVLEVPDRDLAALRDLSQRLGHETQKRDRMNAGYHKAPDQGFDFYGLRLMPGPACRENRIIDPAGLQRNLNAIKTAAATSTFVVAYLHHHHWENDWGASPAWVTSLAHACIDAGAHAFVSHGIPLLLGIEIYRRRPIFYSLGNFIYHTQRPKERSRDDRLWQSVIATCDFAPDGGLTRMELIPVVLGGEAALRDRQYLNRLVPHLAGTTRARQILEALRTKCRAHGTSLVITGSRGYIVPDSADS